MSGKLDLNDHTIVAAEAVRLRGALRKEASRWGGVQNEKGRAMGHFARVAADALDAYVEAERVFDFN